MEGEESWEHRKKKNLQPQRRRMTSRSRDYLVKRTVQILATRGKEKSLGTKELQKKKMFFKMPTEIVGIVNFLKFLKGSSEQLKVFEDSQARLFELLSEGE